MKLLLNGARGRMGQAVAAIVNDHDAHIFAALDAGDAAEAYMAGCDVAMDFSFHTATLPLVALAAKHGKPVVIGTTGHTAEARAAIEAYASQIPMVWAGNFSIGVNLLLHLTEQAAALLSTDYHPEIIEIHHAKKKDAPSGTAENLVSAILRGRSWSAQAVRHGRSGITGERPDVEIGVHAVRGGDVVGEHTVLFAGQGERIELKHQATDRRIFAQGAIAAAHWVRTRPAGLYGMREVLGITQ